MPPGPLSHSNVTDQPLVISYFEDWLKDQSFRRPPWILFHLLIYKSLDITSLLRSHLKCEQILLRKLVKMLVRLSLSYPCILFLTYLRLQGDTESAICASTLYYLLVLQSIRQWKTIIIQETACAATRGR
jgi:hypothetical protein